MQCAISAIVGVDVRERERAEQPEATRVVDDRASTGFVHLAGEVDRGRVVGEVDAGRRDRQQRRGDPEPVHERPRVPPPTSPGSAGMPSGWAWPARSSACRYGSGR